MIQLKTPEQVQAMRRAGLVVAELLELLRDAVHPGVTTADLDAAAAAHIKARGATPNFLNYNGFPATICASINEEIVHGIPGNRVLNEGDIVSLDCGAIVNGWHGDAAITVPVGEVAPELTELMAVTEGALWHAFASVRLGGHVSDIGHAVESYVRAHGDYGIVEEYVGHGIGTEMHQDPNVPNYGRAGRGPELVQGLVLAVEPMVNLGGRETRQLDDGWTVVTQDGQRSAHFEHTFTLTPEGPWVLTALDGGRSRFEALGVPVPAYG
jgi:methionyl aminopeptidase